MIFRRYSWRASISLQSSSLYRGAGRTHTYTYNSSKNTPTLQLSVLIWRYKTDTSGQKKNIKTSLFVLFLQFNFFSYLVCEAIGTAATPGLLCQHRVIVKMIVEKQMECRLAGETEVLGENLPHRNFCPSQNHT
jgi:hypothetical protein